MQLRIITLAEAGKEYVCRGWTHSPLAYLDRILKIQFSTLYNWLVALDRLLIMPPD